jgi:hypothetical protein
MLYFIYHPIDGIINHDCQAGVYMYKHVHTIEADSFEEAFRLSQNDNEQYALLNVRSTCVGDIIQSTADLQEHSCHVVNAVGFRNVPDTWLSFIDWGVVTQSKKARY